MSRITPRALALAALPVLAWIGLLLLAAGPARADVFGATSLLSASPFGQAEYAHDPAVSEDGAFVVFDGSVGGVKGVWRRSTIAGSSFEQVAGGDATLPSVSADGRYVSFTTNEGAQLASLTDGKIHTGKPVQESPGVYVRDMDVEPSQAGAFTLASAKDHSSQSLTYEFPGVSGEQLEVDETGFGATAAGRSAITADGRTVVFVTTAQSDLAGPGTPPLQVAVRDLDTRETKLVSVRFDPETGKAAIDPATHEPEPVPEEEGQYGAVWTNGRPPIFAADNGVVSEPYAPPDLAGASISADGSAVAWLGGHVQDQARLLSGEQSSTLRYYAEPLWRHITGDPLEATRRVSGGSDPENPACEADPEAQLPATPSASDPCQGPFATQSSGGRGLWNAGSPDVDFIPRLSAEGNYVAFIATAPLVSSAGGFGLGGGELNSDVYRQDMAAPDKTSGLVQLTEFASAEKDRISTNGDISDVAISPDGSQVAFTTKRTVFPLGAPAFTSVPAAVPGLGELYDADLGNETLTRVTQGYEGGAPEHPEIELGNEDRYDREGDGALSPSFGANATELVFSSTASNLVFGDGNTPANAGAGAAAGTDGADAFLVPRIVFSPEPTPQTISPPPANPVPVPPWKLSLSASSLADGEVQLRVQAPAAGAVGVLATSSLPASAARRSRRKVRRTVASAATASAGASVTVVLDVRLSRRYRALASRDGGLPSTMTIRFTSSGHPTLVRAIAVRFVQRRSRSGR
jgi:hypothetical protein